MTHSHVTWLINTKHDSFTHDSFIYALTIKAAEQFDRRVQLVIPSEMYVSTSGTSFADICQWIMACTGVCVCAFLSLEYVHRRLQCTCCTYVYVWCTDICQWYMACTGVHIQDVRVEGLCFRGQGTGWRRPIRCLKLQVIFYKRATNYRALLRKMTHKDQAFYGSSPPCTCIDIWNVRVCECMYVYMYVYVYFWVKGTCIDSWNVRVARMCMCDVLIYASESWPV